MQEQVKGPEPPGYSPAYTPAAPPPMVYHQQMQPQPTMPGYHHTTIVTTQPAQFTNGVRPPNMPYRDWSSPLCSCCDDMESCCLVFLFGGMYMCCLYNRHNENLCAPLCFPDCGLTALRVKHRSRHGVHGSICNDLLISCFCGACVMCQLKRDMDFVEHSGQAL